MRRARLRRTALLAAAIAGGLSGIMANDVAAHKPITSPYTFNEDVFPIVKERCAACHAPGGVGPMSLLTHADAVPWGESMKAELMAGHMPPWGVTREPGRFRNVQLLTARELNVLLTWASGGTPPGDTEREPARAPFDPRWPLGEPDHLVALPETTLVEDEQDVTREFRVATGLTRATWVRAADLLPGTPAIVRGATISVRQADGSSSGGPAVERVLALWLPGDHPVALDPGAGFLLPPAAELLVRVRYRKTWEYERARMSDRSTIGLYRAGTGEREVRALRVEPENALQPANGSVTFAIAVTDPLQALAVYPDPSLANASVTLTAVSPGGSRQELIAFRPRIGWARRYWFREPITLLRGTRLEVRALFDDGSLLPPGTPPLPPADVSAVRLFLNVVNE